MRFRCRHAVFVASGLIAGFALPPTATARDGSAEAPAAISPIPPGAVPEPAVARRAQLDQLFERLLLADGASAARPIEGAILTLLGKSNSASIDLLMARGYTLMREEDLEGSLALYNAIVALAPDFAAAWRQRGIVRARHGDGAEARDDLRKALELEPRDIAAMSNLGNVLEQMGNSDGALRMYLRLLAIDPHIEGVAERAKRLRRAIEKDSI